MALHPRKGLGVQLDKTNQNPSTVLLHSSQSNTMLRWLRMAECKALQAWDIFDDLFARRKLYLGFIPSAVLPEILQSPLTAPTHTKTLGIWWVFSVPLSCERSAQWCQSAPRERCSLHDPSLGIEVTPHCSHCPFNQLFLLSPEGLSVLPLLFENVSSFLPLPLLSSLFPYFHFPFTAKHNYFQDPLKTDPSTAPTESVRVFS